MVTALGSFRAEFEILMECGAAAVGHEGAQKSIFLLGATPRSAPRSLTCELLHALEIPTGTHRSPAPLFRVINKMKALVFADSDKDNDLRLEFPSCSLQR